MSLDVRVAHRFPGFTLDISFSAPTPGVVALSGASGAGKSTLLAALAGLLRPDQAEISLDGQVLAAPGQWLPPERRGVGLVFQNTRLFPHLSVAGNLRYGLRRAGRQAPARIGFDDVVALLGIGHLLARRPRSLSGGERQRVAIGRALLAQPRLLLLDEPLASLDGPRKAEILPYLARLKSALGLPMVYVTHAPEEIAALADTLVLIAAGRVQAAGPLGQIAARADLPMAATDDAAGVLEAEVLAHDPARGLTALALPGIDARLWVRQLAAPPGSRVRLRIPAREIILATDAPRGISLHNILPATIIAIVMDAASGSALVSLSLGEARLLARVTADAIATLALAPGRPVLALCKSVAVQVLG